MTQSIIFFNASSTFDLVRDLVFEQIDRCRLPRLTIDLAGGGVWNVVILS